MYDIVLSFLTAFFITYTAIPSIINVAKIRHLTDKPGERSSHTESIPTLGGIGIFAGLIFAVTFWTPFSIFVELKYILCALIIIFLIGAKDDLVPLTPLKKLMGQVAAACILVYAADIRITYFHGIFGIGELPYWVSLLFSVFTIIVINNAFNLIDGINGLASSIGTIICVTFGFWFYVTDHIELGVLAAATVGGLIAFMKYNFTPAKIFMGDTGSLIVGLVCSILAIKFIEINHTLPKIQAIQSVPAVTMGIMIIPLFDTIRVFTIRLADRRSPFSPDKNHIHHLMIDIGLTHMQATTALVFVNLAYIFMVLQLQTIGSLNLIFLLLAVSLAATQTLHYFARVLPKQRLAMNAKGMQGKVTIGG